MTPDQARAELEEEPPIPSSAPELIGWEPLTHPIAPTHDEDLVELMTSYLSMKITRPVRIVRHSDGLLCMWEKTARVRAWLTPELP